MDTLAPLLQKLTGLTTVPDDALAKWILHANGVAYAANASAQTQQEAVHISVTEFANNHRFNQIPSVQYQEHPDQYTLVPDNPDTMPVQIVPKGSDQFVPFNPDDPQNAHITDIWGQSYIAVYTGRPPSTIPTLDPITLGTGMLVGGVAEEVALAGAGARSALSAATEDIGTGAIDVAENVLSDNFAPVQQSGITGSQLELNFVNQPLAQAAAVVSDGGQLEFATPSVQPGSQVSAETQLQLGFPNPVQTAQQFQFNFGSAAETVANPVPSSLARVTD